ETGFQPSSVSRFKTWGAAGRGPGSAPGCKWGAPLALRAEGQRPIPYQPGPRAQEIGPWNRMRAESPTHPWASRNGALGKQAPPAFPIDARFFSHGLFRPLQASLFRSAWMLFPNSPSGLRGSDINAALPVRVWRAEPAGGQ